MLNVKCKIVNQNLQNYISYWDGYNFLFFGTQFMYPWVNANFCLNKRGFHFIFISIFCFYRFNH